MNCLDCGAKFKLKELSSTARHCPGCGHEVVAVPKEDGISDRQIAKLLSKLAGAEQLPLYPEHLAYALSANPKKKSGPIGCLIVGTIILFSVVGFAFWLLPIVIVGAFIAWRMTRKRDSNYAASLKLAKRFGKVNRAFADSDEPTQTVLDETLGATCKQVLVVSSERFSRYLHAAQFPLKHACPVLGPKLAELGLYPALEARLGSDTELKILLLTDYTPAGLEFAQTLPGPLASRTDVHHIGMDGKFVEQLKTAARPLDEFPGAQSRVSKQLGGNGAELFALGPAAMVGALAVALTSLALIMPADAMAHTQGGSGGMDSE